MPSIKNDPHKIYINWGRDEISLTALKGVGNNYAINPTETLKQTKKNDTALIRLQAIRGIQPSVYVVYTRMDTYGIGKDV